MSWGDSSWFGGLAQGLNSVQKLIETADAAAATTLQKEAKGEEIENEEGKLNFQP